MKKFAMFALLLALCVVSVGSITGCTGDKPADKPAAGGGTGSGTDTPAAGGDEKTK